MATGPGSNTPSMISLNTHSQPLVVDGRFTSVKTILSVDGRGSGTLGSVSTGLEALKSVLAAVNTFPFVQNIASIGIEILQIIIVSPITTSLLSFRTWSQYLLLGCPNKQ